MSPFDPAPLLASIYDTVLAPQRWTDVLAQLGSRFDCHFGAFIETSPDRDRPQSIARLGIERDDHQDFLATWHARNLIAAKRPVRRAGEVIRGSDIMPRAELIRSDIYTSFLHPREMHEALRFDLLCNDNVIQAISLGRPWSKGPFEEDEIRRARAIIAHLQQAATMANRLHQAEAHSQGALAALDLFAHPVLLLDRNGRVIHASAAAEAMLHQQDGLSATRVDLRAATPALTARLATLLRRAAGEGGRIPIAGAMRLPRPSGRAAFSLMAMPLSGRGDAGFTGHPAILATLSDPTADIAPDAGLLTALYGLTTAEARLAADLLSGRSVTEIATASGRSTTTMRTHLARLMAKTQTRRQSELMRLLTSLPRSHHH